MLQFFETLKIQAGMFFVNAGLALVVFAAFWLAAKAAGRIALGLGKRFGEGREDVVALLAQTVRGTLLTIGVVTALGTAGINVSALVAGLGLTGFAMGFAFRDALSNLLAGVMILLYRPFHRGDAIAVTTYEGVVTEVNLRYTVVESKDARILIPNSTMLTNPIVVRQKAADGK